MARQTKARTAAQAKAAVAKLNRKPLTMAELTAQVAALSEVTARVAAQTKDRARRAPSSTHAAELKPAAKADAERARLHATVERDYSDEPERTEWFRVVGPALEQRIVLVSKRRDGDHDNFTAARAELIAAIFAWREKHGDTDKAMLAIRTARALTKRDLGKEPTSVVAEVGKPARRGKATKAAATKAQRAEPTTQAAKRRRGK